LALGGHTEAEIADALLEDGIADWDHCGLVENFCNNTIIDDWGSQNLTQALMLGEDSLTQSTYNAGNS
jgi:hypothetical protein